PQAESLLGSHDEPPALLHGDLWSGNVFWSTTGPVLIDPAVYYGSREADLAFTECFGRFPEDFYDAYHEAYPLAPGYDERREVLNLYHLMTHANMFGGGYIDSALSVLRRLAD
ncbi:MAG: fructosamine kinase family protein, partial [Bdellovibrionales bacterium]|nr:fructosamine kinase family protein [Bdellovibrionales bacterium]